LIGPSCSKPESCVPTNGPKHSPSQLAEIAGVSTDTISTYAKKAGVTRPGIGQKNFRYSADDAIRIFQEIVDSGTSTETIQRCKSAIENWNKGRPKPEDRK